MAKEDFCFTYYDGDAARDMAHMNRLERGAYTDIIISQRKFGRLSLDQIKKILGKDFSDCWGAVELVMKFEDNKYYIEWVATSLFKMKKHSGHQKVNGENGGRPPKQFYEFKKRIDENIDKIDFDFEIGFCEKERRQCQFNDKNFKYYTRCIKYLTKIKPNQNPNPENKKPLGNGNGDGKGFVFENGNENGAADENFLIPQMLHVWKKKKPNYPHDKNKDFLALGELAKFICEQLAIPYNPRDESIAEKVLEHWEIMADFISKTDHINSYNLAQVAKYSQTIVQKIQNGSSDSKTPKKGTGKVTGQQLNKAFDEFYSPKKSP